VLLVGGGGGAGGPPRDIADQNETVGEMSHLIAGTRAGEHGAGQAVSLVPWPFAGHTGPVAEEGGPEA